MIFKLSTATAAPLTKKTAIKKPTEVSNGQLTGLAKSIVEKEAAPKQLAGAKPAAAPISDLTANKNDASLALGKLNPDIKAKEIGNITDNTYTNKFGGTSTVTAAKSDKGEFAQASNISDIKNRAKLPAGSVITRPPAPVRGAPEVPPGTIAPPAPPAEEQRPDVNTYSDITAAPATTDVGLKELPEGPMGVQTDMESTIETARTALDKMLTEGADPALRAEAEATLREAEAASVKDTRKSQALGATGLSGAGGRLESDVRKLGKRETVTGMDEYDRAARQEEAARLAEGLGLQGDIQRAELERLAVERARKQLGTVEESANGTIVERQPDGSTRTTSPNGDVTVIKANGDKIITHPDGSEEQVLAPKTQLPPFTGTSVVAGSPGQTRKTFEVRTERGDGVYTENSPLYTSEDGYQFKLYRDPDGSVFLMAA